MDIDKLRKLSIRGKIRKFDTGGPFSSADQNEEYQYLINNGYSDADAKSLIQRDANLDVTQFSENQNSLGLDSTLRNYDLVRNAATLIGSDIKKSNAISNFFNGGNLIGSEGFAKAFGGGNMYSAIGNVASKALDAVDNALMGDKNFGALSATIDSAVDGLSTALINSGNPYALAFAGALKVGNFLTKATGQTTQGYDVNIENSGYGNLGHKESTSSRNFGLFLNLMLKAKLMDAKLQRRNEEAQMALKAANVSDTIKFEQEARMNSVDDVIQANKIALAGGIDTSLLSA